MKSPISKDATIAGMKPNSYSHLMKWGIVVGLTLLYAGGAPFLIPKLGPAITALSGFPVVAAGWYFELPGGIIASVLAIILSIILLGLFGSDPSYITDQSGFSISAVILIVIGISAGRMKQVYKLRIQTEAQLRERERFLSLLNDMTRSVITAQDFDTIMQTLANDLTTLLKADTCYITRWDADNEQVFPVATNAEAGHPFLTMQYPRGEKNLTTSALEAGHVLVIEDILNTEFTSRRTAQNFPEKSFISIPLIYGEHKLGAAIVGCHKSNQFAAERIQHAEQAADQIALAIWNTQQEIELHRNLHEAQTLSEIALALSETERIGLDNVLQLIVVSAKELIPNVEQAVIHLLDDKQQVLTYGAVIGFDNPDGGKKKMRVGEGIAGQVVISGETINITDVTTDPRFLKLDTDPNYRSLMVTPVRSGEQKLGTISVSSNLPFAFGSGDIKLLSQLGIQAAIAIENTHLLESIQQALKESNALYRINQGLVASLDPQELLKDVVTLLQKNFGYYHVQIYVLEPETGDFVLREGSGEIGAQLKEQGHRLHAGEGIVGYTAETNAAFFTNDVDKILSFERNPLLPDIKSELAVPVKVDHQILGLLDIQQAPPAYLSQRDLQLVSAVADQLAIALQKADLYSELQAALQVETAIRNQMVQSERLVTMGRLLASVSHELNNPLQAIQNALFLLREEKGISMQGKLDLDIVLSEAERMSALIERLRATYRPIQAEDFRPTQINTIVEDVYALISTYLRHNEIYFEFFPDPALPLIPVLPDQIRQVVINLLMNAVEAMTIGGKITVSTQLLQDTKEILLTVSDTGTGVPLEILPNIFEAFVTNKPSGTGLGLTITYDIVMKHCGRIAAENNPDKGSTFKVWLPTPDSEIQ
jgi:signal transduction histidine kinase